MRTALLLPLLIATLAAAPPKIEVQRCLSDGIEPRLIVDARGIAHLLFFSGDPKAGDFFYSERPAGQHDFRIAHRVNPLPGAATVMGAVRGPQMTLDRNGNPIVLFTGSDTSQPKPRLAGLPLLVARPGPVTGSAWTQAQVIPSGVGIDGGASIATSSDGQVNVIWHAPAKSDGDEQSRRLWVARSSDDGKSFAGPVEIDSAHTGACGCCALAAFADGDRLDILYRTADQMVHRNVTFVSLDSALKPSAARTLSEDKVSKCIMSTFSSAANVIAWESHNQIMLARTSGGEPVKLGDSKQNPKHPRVATSGDYVLATWTEKTSWNKGGALAWQLLDRNLKPIDGASGTRSDLPVWGYPAVAAQPDGSFLILY